VRKKVVLYNDFQKILDSANARIGNSRLTAKLFHAKPSIGIHLGLDTNYFKPTTSTSFRERYGIHDNKYLLVTSRIHNTKGQDWAIRALQYIPNDIILVLAGNTTIYGPKHEDNIHTRRAREIIDSLNLRDRIIFTGFLNQDELIQAYSGAICTIVPSVWLETFGYVTVESMSCECPVVVTENCGSAELVTNGIDGYVIPRMNIKAISDAVEMIIPRRSEMGLAARYKIKKELSWIKITQEVLQVMKISLKGHCNEKHHNKL
jgi:glycosyltransferase involved in cell wall biosynthesis